MWWCFYFSFFFFHKSSFLLLSKEKTVSQFDLLFHKLLYYCFYELFNKFTCQPVDLTYFFAFYMPAIKFNFN